MKMAVIATENTRPSQQYVLCEPDNPETLIYRVLGYVELETPKKVVKKEIRSVHSGPPDSNGGAEYFFMAPADATNIKVTYEVEE